MRLLIVEDEEDLLYALKKGLSQEGYAVDGAVDGEEAVSLLEVNDYDAMVLDINLPLIDGFGVLAWLRERDKDMKVLILSAKSDIDDRVTGLDKGANDYLVKPFHIKELKARLLTIPTLETVILGKRSPLMVAVGQTTASLYKCFSGELRRISYPEM